ncbi:MAG: hypothetical protein HY791_07845 [Deltaproteobacteria bacterium]|nr:hypothetical protein [Deltaproteobacteria bacterium]
MIVEQVADDSKARDDFLTTQEDVTLIAAAPGCASTPTSSASFAGAQSGATMSQRP